MRLLRKNGRFLGVEQEVSYESRSLPLKLGDLAALQFRVLVPNSK